MNVYITPLVMTKPGKVSDGLRLSPADGLPVVFSGLSYGSYAVQARERVAPDAGRGRLYIADPFDPPDRYVAVKPDVNGVIQVK